MEPASDWARLKRVYDEEEYWRTKGELAVRVEMECRLAAYFERKKNVAEVARIAAALAPRPRLVDIGTSGHLNMQNRLNRDRAAAGQPRQRELNQIRREQADQPEDIRRWRQSPR